MDRLCDEILQLIFFELADPTSLTLASKRFHRFSQQPYVRAQYFLIRYGQIQAMFWAFGRGKLITEKVLDILLASGAHLSRYLIQVAIHHYFRTTSHFIKTNWVRSVPLPAFSYFLKVASDLYGEVPMGKGEDDGSIFSSFLKESRFPAELKSITWEEIRDILVKYKFIPFSHKDPIMATFPLALAVEPRLLPYAVDNGFKLDPKYRDFVFRKMFERGMPSESRVDDIVHNVCELNRLDRTMFVSRTVAAEVCMEAKINEHAYNALKRLDKAGALLFELPALVEELIKLFIKTRSITTSYTTQVLRQLYTDFPSSDPTVRTVLLLTVFLSDNCLAHTTPATLKSKFEPLGLTPLTRKDIFNVLVNPFVERYPPILEYARVEVGLNAKEGKELVEEVAVRCLEIGCKGKTLKKLCEGFPPLHASIATVVLQRFQIELDDLPQPEDELACGRYEAKLCRDFIIPKYPDDGPAPVELDGQDEGNVGSDEDDAEADEEREELVHGPESHAEAQSPELVKGRIGQDTLTHMIRQDELAPARARRRAYFGYPTYGDMAGRLHYPSDYLQVGRWIKDEFGPRSRVTAIFMTHAIINDNTHILHQYLPYSDNPTQCATANHVPITLKHFKLLARLGRSPSWCLYHEIEIGAEFFFSDEDYIIHHDTTDYRKKYKIKIESPSASISSASSSAISSPSKARKRPRRAAAAAPAISYVVPDSDDEAIVDENAESCPSFDPPVKKKRKLESNFSLWLKHLTILLKEEQRKYKDKKKRIEKSAPPGEKVRVPKSEFLKSLSTNLRNLRKMELEERATLFGPDVHDDDYSDDGDDEYLYRMPRRRRRTGVKAS